MTQWHKPDVEARNESVGGCVLLALLGVGLLVCGGAFGAGLALLSLAVK